MTLTRSNPTYHPLTNRSSLKVTPFPYIGLVKRNDDPQHMGRLSVWIPEIGGDPLTESSWILCSYCSVMAGATDITELPNYKTDPSVAQVSYGWVSVPPDINTEVMVLF